MAQVEKHLFVDKLCSPFSFCGGVGGIGCFFPPIDHPLGSQPPATASLSPHPANHPTIWGPSLRPRPLNCLVLHFHHSTIWGPAVPPRQSLCLSGGAASRAQPSPEWPAGHACAILFAVSLTASGMLCVTSTLLLTSLLVGSGSLVLTLCPGEHRDRHW